MITTRFPHLQAMGIQQWVRRELSLEESVEPVESAIAEPSIEHYATQVQWQPAAGANLLLITPPLEGAAEQLLGAMLLSIGIPVAGCYRGTEKKQKEEKKKGQKTHKTTQKKRKKKTKT